jgi:predicted nuclease of predicted toxin-antitoxin system
MKIKTDENLPVEVAEDLRGAGHDAVTVLDQRLGGRGDPDVAAACRREGRALVTLDLDFANVRRYPPADHPGIVVLRLVRQDKPYVLDVMRRPVPLLASEPRDRRLWIVEEARIRVRE